MTDNLLRRIERLESLEAIRKLKHLYCKHCDNGYQPDAIASLFWDDAVWDAGPGFGSYRGPEAIGEFFASVSAQIIWARHLVVNELIEVDGDRATGEFQIIQPCTFASGAGGQAAWLIGKYDEVYTRREGVWKYQRLRAEIEFITPYEQGWHKAKSLDG